MRRTTVMLPDHLIDGVREHRGARGLGPLVRDLLEAWLRDQNAPADVPRRGGTLVFPVVDVEPGHRPPVLAPPVSTPDEVTCRRCGGPARFDFGKRVCQMRCDRG